MSTTMRAGGAGTSDMFADWETGVYTLEVTGLTATESTLYKNQDGTPKEQIEVRFVLPDVADPQDGTPLKRKTWLNAYLSGPRPDAKSPRARKGSQLWQLVRAASGVACVDEEEYDLDALCVGKLVRAIVKLNDKGYPSIDNDSFEPLRTKPTPAASVAPPTRPLPPPPSRKAAPVRDQAQLDRLIAAGVAAEIDEAGLDAWATKTYTHGLAALTPEECEELIAALGGAPF